MFPEEPKGHLSLALSSILKCIALSGHKNIGKPFLSNFISGGFCKNQVHS